MTERPITYFNRAGQVLDWRDSGSIERVYWSAVLQEVPLYYRLIITENPVELPFDGQDVVVILKSDEFLSEVVYANRVRAVFRCCYGDRYRMIPNIYFLPLPYLGTLERIEVQRVASRPIDVFFAGQVRFEERTGLEKIVRGLQADRPDLVIEFKATKAFFTGMPLEQYLQQLASVKVALCPHGAALETYRHFEVMRYGCIPISLAVPDVWYLRNAPMLFLDNWTQLPQALDVLFKNKKRMEQLSQDAVNYWQKYLSSKGVAAYINQCLKNNE